MIDRLVLIEAKRFEIEHNQYRRYGRRVQRVVLRKEKAKNWIIANDSLNKY